MPIKYGSPLFKDILDYGRAGDIAKWLREHNECELADGVDFIADDIGDGEYMSCISDIIIGKKVSSSKPEFSKLFSVEDIKVDELDNETVVCVSLKVMRVINESYFLMIRSSWGTRAMNINPLYFKQGIVTKQEFRFRKRPTPITRIELYADGKKLKIIENALTFQVEDSMFKMIFELLKYPLYVILLFLAIFIVLCSFWFVLRLAQGKRIKKGSRNFIKKDGFFYKVFVKLPKQVVDDFFERDPDFFAYQGCIIFEGRQGAGKSIGMIEFARRMQAEYPLAKCITNIGYTQEDVALRIGKSQSAVAN